MMTSFSDVVRSPRTKWLVIVFVLAIMTALAIPRYVTGNWSWRQVPDLANISQLRQLQEQGLSLPGWQTLQQNEVDIGGHNWSVQALMPTESSEAGSDSTADEPVILMLRPQIWVRDLPQVDWTDIHGVQRWTEDSQRHLTVTVPPLPGSDASPYPVTARFLRGWTPQRTYAVLQWYAWADGGHPAPSIWFWADQWSQLQQQQRQAWVAVSVLIPMKPLGDIETVRSQAEALGQLVQTVLMGTLTPQS